MNTPTTREQRAAQIVSADGVRVVNSVDRTFDVQSQAHPNKQYRVNLKRGVCECKDFERSGLACKHILAAQKFAERQAQQAAAADKPQFKNYDALFAALA